MEVVSRQFTCSEASCEVLRVNWGRDFGQSEHNTLGQIQVAATSGCNYIFAYFWG